MIQVTRSINYAPTPSTSSSPRLVAAYFLRGVRSHWNIEINLHWSPDISFDNDRNRTQCEKTQENLSILKRIALNMLNKKIRPKLVSKQKEKSGLELSPEHAPAPSQPAKVGEATLQNEVRKILLLGEFA